MDPALQAIQARTDMKAAIADAEALGWRPGGEGIFTILTRGAVGGGHCHHCQ